jgi:hypothetical protein
MKLPVFSSKVNPAEWAPLIKKSEGYIAGLVAKKEARWLDGDNHQLGAQLFPPRPTAAPAPSAANSCGSISDHESSLNAEYRRELRHSLPREVRTAHAKIEAWPTIAPLNADERERQRARIAGESQ